VHREVYHVPPQLHDALHFARKSDFVREVLGERVVEQFLQLKYAEWSEYQTQVTDWELKRYFAVL